jgi:hypothetical protein
MNDSLQLDYRRLAELIHADGERFPKRHGSWIRLRLAPDFSLVMGSWNRSIALVAGDAPFANEVTGFEGRVVARLGIDFGGFALYVSAERLHGLLRVAEAAVEGGASRSAS